MAERANPIHNVSVRSDFADDADMAEIVELFVDEMPAKVEGLKRAFEALHLEELRRLSHQLKGSCGGYGFGELGASAGRLEQALSHHGEGAGSGDPVGEIRERFEELIGLCQRVRK